MTPIDFCYKLQGFIEISNITTPSDEQWLKIVNMVNNAKPQCNHDHSSKMSPNHFLYWLKGYVDIGGGTPNLVQWEIIKDHLQLVFEKVTPDRWTADQAAKESTAKILEETKIWTLPPDYPRPDVMCGGSITCAPFDGQTLCSSK